MRSALALLSLALLSACRSTTAPTVAPLAVLREVDVRYRAELAPERASAAGAERTLGSAQPAEAAPAPGAHADVVRVDCDLVRLDADVARSIVRGAPSVFGVVVAESDLARVRARRAAGGHREPAQGPSLRVKDGTTGSLALLSERAYVQGFTIESASGAMIGDPRVDVAREGTRVDAKAMIVASGAVELDVTVSARQLLAPFEEASVRLPGTATEVALEIPIAFGQELGAVATLAPDEVLVLGSLPAKDGTQLVACIRARRAAPELASAR